MASLLMKSAWKVLSPKREGTVSPTPSPPTGGPLHQHGSAGTAHAYDGTVSREKEYLERIERVRHLLREVLEGRKQVFRDLQKLLESSESYGTTVARIDDEIAVLTAKKAALETEQRDVSGNIDKFRSLLEMIDRRIAEMEAKIVEFSEEVERIKRSDHHKARGSPGAGLVRHVANQDAPVGSPFLTLAGHTGTVTALHFAAKEQLIASGGMWGMIHVTHSGVLTPHVSYEAPSPVTCLQLVPCRNLILSGHEDGMLRTWLLNQDGGAVAGVAAGIADAGRGEPKGCIKSHVGPVLCVQCAVPTGGDQTLFAVSGGQDGTICVWNLEDETLRRKIHQAHLGGVTSLQFFDYVLVTAGTDGYVRTWDLRSGAKFLDKRVSHMKVVAVQFDGREVCSIATADEAGVVSTWQVNDDTLSQQKRRNFGESIRDMHFTGDDVAVCLHSGHVAIVHRRDLADKTLIHNQVHASCLQLTNGVLVTGGTDGQCKFWQLEATD